MNKPLGHSEDEIVEGWHYFCRRTPCPQCLNIAWSISNDDLETWFTCQYCGYMYSRTVRELSHAEVPSAVRAIGDEESQLRVDAASDSPAPKCNVYEDWYRHVEKGGYGVVVPPSKKGKRRKIIRLRQSTTRKQIEKYINLAEEGHWDPEDSWITEGEPGSRSILLHFGTLPVGSDCCSLRS